MGIVLWITFGLAAGSVARWVMPGPRAGGLIAAMTIGAGGALVGGSVGTAVANPTLATFDFRSLLMAINTTLIVLLIYRCLAMRGTAHVGHPVVVASN
jgi:uncharacterized membrane protein YeaQ/YmgE (transglycosylase-associated protein family)